MPGPHSQKFWVHSAVGRSMNIGILYPLPRDTAVQLILKTQAPGSESAGVDEQLVSSKCEFQRPSTEEV